jgi:hypothetical protein
MPVAVDGDANDAPVDPDDAAVEGAQRPTLDVENANVFGNQYSAAPTGKKRKRTQLSASGKVDAVYNSLDALDAVRALIRSVEEVAGEGLLLARKLLAEGLGVPVEMVHFLPRGLRCNVDDMACFYSREVGFCVEKEKGLVLKDNVNGPANRSYSVHTPASEASTKKFDGVKARYTTLLADSGHMGRIWIQFPGLSEKELPPDKVPKGFIIMEVEGLTLVRSNRMNCIDCPYCCIYLMR